MVCMSICKKQKTSRVVCACIPLCVGECIHIVRACVWKPDINCGLFTPRCLPYLAQGLSLNLEQIVSHQSLEIYLVRPQCICEKPGPLHSCWGSLFSASAWILRKFPPELSLQPQDIYSFQLRSECEADSPRVCIFSFPRTLSHQPSCVSLCSCEGHCLLNCC